MPGHETDPTPCISQAAPDTGRLDALVHDVARGSKPAFAQLHRAVSGQLYAYLRTLSCDPEAIADLMSATFYEVWLLAGAHDGDQRDAWQWIRDIASRRVADRRSTPPSDGPIWAQAAEDRTTSLAVRALIQGRSSR